MKNNEAPKKIYLKDYREPSYWIKKTTLDVQIYDGHTDVTATLLLERNANDESRKLSLDGDSLELRGLTLDGKKLDDTQYVLDAEHLTLENLSDQHELIIETRIYPETNTSLEGLYKSRLIYCTQCEAEGFRKITYYLDRPDVMSEFTTRITADKTRCPILLSNGNKIDEGECANDRHFAVWHDPHLKPAYLFALVAGELSLLEDRFTTCSGRDVLLQIWVEEKDLDKCAHAMDSLKRSMAWDEQRYGREYDLDIFMIVAVDDFNMGAMENKGLNIFNTSCVLAKKETTTDAEFQRVEGVVAHEYFHNWSGNRVTCRDWFQLSLKEGFTVFRDAQFSSDMGSATVKRVEDVLLLRAAQFAEDAGPMAHPVQPDAFIEISNFYTLTIYEKGAEVVRMLHTLLGETLFRKGSDLYFERHDGQAVTIDDFVRAMEEVSGRDLSQFKRWYKQAGTPELEVSSEYIEASEEYVLQFKQRCRPTVECKEKQPFVIPVDLSLLGDAGKLPLNLKDQLDPERSDNTRMVIELTEAEERFVFTGVKELPAPALLRGFSAPVKLRYRYTDEQLLRILKLEDDGFCRWDAAQQLMIREIDRIREALVADPSPAISPALVDALTAVLADDSLDPAMVSLMLTVPSEKYLNELGEQVEVEATHHARQLLERKLAKALAEPLLQCYELMRARQAAKPYSVVAADVAERALQNTALHLLSILGDEKSLALVQQQFAEADNMTDELAAFKALVHSTRSRFDSAKTDAIQRFYTKWQAEALVVNHWFSVQASSPAPDVLEQVKALMTHPAFDMKNPNKLRALIGAFCNNVTGFHNANGLGYAFLGDRIIELNRSNPQIAARLLTPLTKWRRYDEKRQEKMKAQLERIQSEPNLSKDVFEVVSKSLELS